MTRMSLKREKTRVKSLKAALRIPWFLQRVGGGRILDTDIYFTIKINIAINVATCGDNTQKRESERSEDGD